MSAPTTSPRSMSSTDSRSAAITPPTAHRRPSRSSARTSAARTAASTSRLPADSVLPATCGGLRSVLHCDHTDTTTAEHHEGTLREPRRIVRTVCTACGTELHRDERTLSPIAVEDIPLHLLGGVNLDAIARDHP